MSANGSSTTTIVKPVPLATNSVADLQGGAACLGSVALMESIPSVAPNNASEAAAYAEAYARAGFHPIILRDGQKTPNFSGWQQMESQVVVQILGAVSHFNVGMGLSQEHMVLDVDCKHGVNGFDTLMRLEDQYGALPDTVRQRTPTGGEHILFKLPPGVLIKNAVNIAPGLDIRASGGFIVAEPSKVGGNGYAWTDWDVLDEPMPALAQAPDWLLAMCRQHGERPKGDGKSSVETMDRYIAEGRRNDTLFRKACALRAQEMNKDEIDAALQSLNSRMCRPPLPVQEVARIAHSATSYSPNPDMPVPERGGLSGFGLKERAAARLYKGEPKPVTWLVERIFPVGKVAVLASPPGIGKSFLALDLALKVAVSPSLYDGAAFVFGGRVKSNGRVIVISAEDDDDELHRRLHALCDGRAMPDNLHVVSLPDQGHFCFVQDVPRVGILPTRPWMVLKEEIAQFDDVRLIIVDTLQAVSAGDLNAAEIAQAMMNELVELAKKTGAAVVVLHHLVKSAVSVEKGMLGARAAMDAIRGSGAIAGSARAAYCLFPHPQGKDICELMNIKHEENKVVYGLVAKANGDARRDYTVYIRDDMGVLRDRTDEVRRRKQGNTSLLITELLKEVTLASQKGRPFAAGCSSANSLHKRRFEMPKQFHDLPAKWFVEHAEMLEREGKLEKIKLTNGYQYVPVIPVDQEGTYGGEDGDDTAVAIPQPPKRAVKTAKAVKKRKVVKRRPT